jgi:hypothetical protein
MMNWIYTWYNPKVDPDATALARQIADIFLQGALGAWSRQAYAGAQGIHPQPDSVRPDAAG